MQQTTNSAMHIHTWCALLWEPINYEIRGKNYTMLFDLYTLLILLEDFSNPQLETVLQHHSGLSVERGCTPLRRLEQSGIFLHSYNHVMMIKHTRGQRCIMLFSLSDNLNVLCNCCWTDPYKQVCETTCSYCAFPVSASVSGIH